MTFFFSNCYVICLPFCCRGVQLDMQECRQWVSHRLQTRGAKPFEFVQTVPCYNPSGSVLNDSSTGNTLSCFYHPFVCLITDDELMSIGSLNIVLSWGHTE